MNAFQVQDRHLKIYHSFLLEASAGTGKTYSIENIVVRFLIEKDLERNLPPCTIEDLLVVTFTRAATRELKSRIRFNIIKSIEYLDQALTPELSQTSSAPDFIKAIIEKGESSILFSKRLLEQALFCFEQAQIFTIHGFCSRMLRENAFDCELGSELPSGSDSISLEKVSRIIRDFLRTEIRPEYYSLEQLKIILKEYRNDINLLENALAKLIASPLEIRQQLTYKNYFAAFHAAMSHLKNKGYISPEAIIDDFIIQATSYKGIYQKNGTPSPDFSKQVQFFANLFNKDQWDHLDFNRLIADRLSIIDALSPAQLKSKCTPISPDKLHYPDLLSELRSDLLPLVKKASDPLIIFAQMAYECRRIFRKHISEEELAFPDDLLQAMLVGIQQPSFANKIRTRYRAIIIDEFQDTDPIQWKIFKNLFIDSPNSPCALYLVGDPKQSIYSFRQADIYTYLSAVEEIAKERRMCLDTNYRSQPSLIKALNVLFSHTNSPGFIPLPKINHSLEYREVNAPSSASSKHFSDSLGAIHFCIAGQKLGRSSSWPTQEIETEFFFPFIVQEIQRLVRQDGLLFRDFSILVRDRYQAQRIITFLNRWNIPVVSQHSQSLSESLAVSVMRECLEAISHPKDHSAVKTMLGGKLIGLTHEEIRLLNDSKNMEKHLSHIIKLKKCFLNKGIAFCFQELLQIDWRDEGRNAEECLLMQEKGVELYKDLKHLLELLIQHQSITPVSIEGLLRYLDQIAAEPSTLEENLKIRNDPGQDAVQVLTLHMSKGLEFGIVFALGLTNRNPLREELFASQVDGKVELIVPEFDKNAFLEFQKENDSEKMRQLYVAMTRAKYRLYLPVALTEDHPEIHLGCASPMDLFLARLDQPLLNDERLYARIREIDGSDLMKFIDKLPPDCQITYSDLKKQPFSLKQQQFEIPTLIQPKLISKIPGLPSFIHSFSSLARNSFSSETSFQEPPHNHLNELKNIHTLPAGNETGNLLHLILQKIPFSFFNEISSAKDCLPLISPYLDISLWNGWESVFCHLIFNALKTPLSDHFSLCDIDVNQSYREMEFLYPYNRNSLIPNENINATENFLKGFIDLFFVYGGKYYIIDWKSNWLGPSDESYQQENLFKAMETHHYHLQAEIYTEALKRYLKLIDKRPFEDCFGGVYYLFLRGMNPSRGSKYGSYLWRKL